MPDLVTRVVYTGSRGHAFASAFLGRARFRPTEGEPDDVTLWGMLLSGRIKTFGKDYAYGQFTFGDGVGRYRGGVTAVPDANGQLVAPALHAYHGRLRALLGRSRLVERGLQPGGVARRRTTTRPISTRTLDYAAVNLLYWFIKDRAWAGVEYLHGRREVFAGDQTAPPIGFSSPFVSISRS